MSDDFSNGHKWIVETVRENKKNLKDLELQYFKMQMQLQKIEGNTEVIKNWMETKTANEVKISNESVKGRWGMLIAVTTGVITIFTAIIGGVFVLLKG